MGEVCDASVDDGRENPGFPPAAILCWILQPLFLGIKIQNVSRIALQQKLSSLCPSPFAKIPLIYLIFGRLTLPKYQKNISPAAMGAKRLLVLCTFLWMEKPAPARNKAMNSRQNLDPHATGLHSKIHQSFLVSGFFQAYSKDSLRIQDVRSFLKNINPGPLLNGSMSLNDCFMSPAIWFPILIETLT